MDIDEGFKIFFRRFSHCKNKDSFLTPSVSVSIEGLAYTECIVKSTFYTRLSEEYEQNKQNKTKQPTTSK